MLSKIAVFLKKHILLSMVVVLALGGGGYYAYQRLSKKDAAVRYVTTTAEKGTLVSTVSGSGSVSASNTIDLQPKASGNITYLGVVAGQEVKTGAVVATIDSSDAYQSLKDAQDSLETAKLSLEKLKQPTDAFTVLQAQHALDQASEAKTKAEDDIRKGYEDAYNAITDAFLELPDAMIALQDTLYDNTIENGQTNIDYYADAAYRYDTSARQIRDDVDQKYQTARSTYEATYAMYKTTSRYASDDEIEKLVEASYDSSKTIAESVKSAMDFIQFYKDQFTERSMNIPSQVSTHLSNMENVLGQVNGQVSSLLGVRRDLADHRDALASAEWTVTERTEELADLQTGPDALDIRSQELTISQRQNAVTSAQRKLGDYRVVAPFDGVMATVEVTKGASVSTGTTIGTLITRQRVADITLSEVDVAKVAVGQKASLTFDAIPELAISGQVAEVDALGASSQGVVNYGVKIAFDTQDERVKPAMSVTASIIIEAKPDVLLVPASAVKTQNGASYVQVLPEGSAVPTQRAVEVGASNDESVEILSGLSEGESVVTRTIAPTAATTAQPSATQGSALRTFTGGNAGFTGGATFTGGARRQ